jgi:hypothetical protein
MFAILQLHSAVLDHGVSGISPLDLLLLFLMMYGITMVPYFFLYLSLRDRRKEAEPRWMHFGKLGAWMHVHWHPHLLHR